MIENKLLSGAVLESIIGKNGVSPEARRSVASRLSELLKEDTTIAEKVGQEKKGEWERTWVNPHSREYEELNKLVFIIPIIN